MYPVLWLTETLYISTYFLLISVAFSVALIWSVYRAEAAGLERNIILDMGILLMAGGLLGSRLFHVFWEEPSHYAQYPWDVFKIWQGGFVFYGGVLGGVLPSYLFLRAKRQRIGPWLDVLTPVVPLAYAIGRFATLLSGSGYGRPTTLPWAIQYPPGSEAPAGVPVHPTPIYSLFWELGILALVLWLEKKTGPQSFWRRPGARFFALMILHGVGRAIIEQFRDDFRGGGVWGFSISTWLSLIVVAGGLAGLIARARPQSGKS